MINTEKKGAEFNEVLHHFPGNLDQLATNSVTLPTHTPPPLPTSRELNGQMCGAEDCNQSSKLKNRNCVGVAQLYCAVLYGTVLFHNCKFQT